MKVACAALDAPKVAPTATAKTADLNAMFVSLPANAELVVALIFISVSP
jgi:hypothetical protein